MYKGRLKDSVSILLFLSIFVSLVILFYFSIQSEPVFPSYKEKPRALKDVLIQVGDGKPYEATLPTRISELPPRTPVTVFAKAEANSEDRILIKSVFAPLRLYMDGTLIYESGKKSSYPAYMNDPPTILTTAFLSDKKDTLNLRFEYESLTQRSVLSLPLILVGDEISLIKSKYDVDGFSFVYSLMLIFIGLGMILVSLTIIRRIEMGFSFFWLGLFSLASGIWVFGECDFSVFFVPYPVLLYNMAYMGLFTVAIPFLHYGLIVLNPKNKLPFKIMLYIHYISLAVTLFLQFTGKVDFIKSLYWFHIIVPSGFLLFALVLAWEYFRYKSPAAKRFSLGVSLLTVSTLLELANYWLHLTNLLTVFFQAGIICFVIAMGFVSGFYIKEAVQAANEKKLLEYEVAATGLQLELQRQQYQRLAENDAAVKRQSHDLRHQFAVLKHLNSENDRMKLEKYLDSLAESIPVGNMGFYSENYAVNAVASHYGALAEEKNISIDWRFAVPKDLDGKAESDLCIIVGNLLENAIEACNRMKTGERYIYLNSTLDYGMLTIAVENSYDGIVTRKKDIFLSSKREGEGIGISSVKAVAAKHGGKARFEAENDIFRATVYMTVQA